MISSAAGVLFALCAIAALFFFLERKTQARVFRYFPPLLWIYAVPVVLGNVGVLPPKSATYEGLSSYALPSFLVLMLISVDLRAALLVMGRGVVLMLIGGLGIVLGGTLSFALVHRWLSPDAWKIFGGLAGAWTGGTANMAAVAGGLGLVPEDLGVAILADNVVYIVWLPILLSSKSFAERWNRWAKVDPQRVKRLTEAAPAAQSERAVEMTDVIHLLMIVAMVIATADALAPRMPLLEPVLSRSTWRTLLITTFSLSLSFTPARKIPGARSIGLALVYLFLAGMGARARVEGLDDAPLFLLASFLWIAIHGAVCLIGARLLKVDLHSAAIASAANIGGVASAPVVAAHHQEALVPASILMALVGYAAGNYLAVLTAQLCFWVSQM